MSFLRTRCAARGVVTHDRQKTIEANTRVRLAGLVLVRQRPGTASGVIFATIEDETGIANIIIWPKTYERYRRIVLTSRLFGIEGRVQREGIVVHVIADEIEDLTHELSTISGVAEIGDANLARGDIAQDGPDPRLRKAALYEEQQLRAARFVPKSRDFH
jgi:error-prone DNA polymerase